MPVDVFLKLDGTDGEAGDDKYKDWIEVAGFSWGLENAGSGERGLGSGVGKVAAFDLMVMKWIDKSSPGLALSCASGKHYDTAKLYIRKAGGEKAVEYLKYDMEEVFISSYQTGGSGHGDVKTGSTELTRSTGLGAWTKGGITGRNFMQWEYDVGLPMELVTLNFAKIKLTYTVQNKDGTAGASIPKWHDFRKNTSG